MQALVPPKPKLFDIMVFNSASSILFEAIGISYASESILDIFIDLAIKLFSNINKL